MLPFEAAREKVIEICQAQARPAATEEVNLTAELDAALGRVLAESVAADRDYPPFDRSTRDGFAVRAEDVAKTPLRLRLIGESRAGMAFDGPVGAGECVETLTGAPVPRGANAMVMQEYAEASGGEVMVKHQAREGENIVRAGSEARAGQKVLERGTRLGFAELAMAAQVGCARLKVFRRPHVAILSTGDEVVGIGEKPGPFQIRNSNGLSLAAQTLLAGGEPVALGNAPDRAAELRERIERGLAEDVLVLSGGVSAGKYDLVEGVLRELGAEFYFDAVAIRPGRPAVFGRCRGKLIFGLPGNPVSTMVTFELFVVPALDILSGAAPRPLPLFKARLGKAAEQKASLTHFLPARVSWIAEGPVVEELAWQGSGDIVAVARANCFLVVPQAKLRLAEGEWVDVLPRRGIL